MIHWPSKEQKALGRRVFLELVDRRSSEEAVAVMRGMSFGAAGASLAIVLLISQLTTRSMAIDIAIVAAVIALPVWTGLAYGHHLWLSLKIPLPEFTNSGFLFRFVGWCQWVGFISLMAGIGALIYTLSQIAFVVFVLLSGAAMLAIVKTIHFAVRIAIRLEFGSVEHAVAYVTESRETPPHHRGL